MVRLTGKHVVVTGGTGALGRAVTAAVTAEGGSVVVADRSVPAGADEKPGVRFFALDALDEAAVLAFFRDLEPAPTGVVNTIGGYAAGDPVSALELGVLRGQLELNLISATMLTKHAVLRMARAGHGRIVHVSSRAARQSGDHAFAYSVAKLGVLRLVEAVAAETLEQGITINAILPSTIDTPGNRAAMPDADFTRWPKPEQLAQVVAFLLSDEAAVISGAAIPVYGRA